MVETNNNPDKSDKDVAKMAANRSRDLRAGMGKVIDAVRIARGKIPKGSIYKLEMHIEADEFLDWNKPLSEQSDLVKAAIEKVVSDNAPLWDHTKGNRASSGESLYRTLTATWPDAEFTESGTDPKQLASESSTRASRYTSSRRATSAAGTRTAKATSRRPKS